MLLSTRNRWRIPSSRYLLHIRSGSRKSGKGAQLSTTTRLHEMPPVAMHFFSKEARTGKLDVSGTQNGSAQPVPISWRERDLELGFSRIQSSLAYSPCTRCLGFARWKKAKMKRPFDLKISLLRGFFCCCAEASKMGTFLLYYSVLPLSGWGDRLSLWPRSDQIIHFRPFSRRLNAPFPQDDKRLTRN